MSKTEKSNKQPKDEIESKVTSSNPLVFISHDTRDAEIAEEFSNLLKRVSAGVLKSFRSSDKKGTQGIEYGVEWYPQIIKNIQDASDVVCLLTKNSTDRPWILFEAGMAKGKLNTSILGVALGIPLKNASTGPFAQFQNCGDDEDSLSKLVFQLVDRIPNSEPDEETITFHVQKFKSKIDEIFEKRDKESKDKKENPVTEVVQIDDSSVKLFEEIKVMFQDLPGRISKSNPIFRPYNPRMHPRMVEEFIHRSSHNPQMTAIIILSYLRSTIPWIYDLGIETIRKLESDVKQKSKDDIFHQFIRLCEEFADNPMYREFSMARKEKYFDHRELLHLLFKCLDKIKNEKSR